MIIPRPSLFRQMYPAEASALASYKEGQIMVSVSLKDEPCNTNRRQLLAVVLTCLMFHIYLYGRSFTVQSDHIPLEMITMSNFISIPPMLLHIMLNLWPHALAIKYRPGKTCLWQTPCHVSPSQRNKQMIPFDLWVDNIAFSKTHLYQTRGQTVNSLVLSPLYCLMCHDWPASFQHVPRVTLHYWDMHNELYTDDGILLKGPYTIFLLFFHDSNLSNIYKLYWSISKCQ